MTAVPVDQQRKPSQTECQIRAVIRDFVTEHPITERGRPISEVRQNQLARRLAAVVDPSPRPTDAEQPRAPKGAKARAAAIAARQAVLPPEPKPVVAPRPARVVQPLPALQERLDAELRAVVELIGLGFSNPAIGGRLGISEQRVKYAVTRAKARLGVSDRKLLAIALVEVLALGEGDAAAGAGAVCPPAALDEAMRARGASEPQRPAESPFWAIGSVPSVEESPATGPGDASGAPAGHDCPSGPPRPAAGHAEPYSAAEATEAARS